MVPWQIGETFVNPPDSRSVLGCYCCKWGWFWPDLLIAYTTGSDVFICPAGKKRCYWNRPHSYAVSPWATTLMRFEIYRPDELIWIADSSHRCTLIWQDHNRTEVPGEMSGIATWHNGGFNAGYFDGHVGWRPGAKLDPREWENTE